ncbi:unnamed protein product [Brachionus calyciflorus]|uniref:Mitochondrial ribosomal protein L12 n=1 Tax=Brachionus calyciflorus TaxID=104777 RepID=A0A814JUJ2_9BILA|nr:unnamed protein product [Brachionus calyciflorus]
MLTKSTHILRSFNLIRPSLVQINSISSGRVAQNAAAAAAPQTIPAPHLEGQPKDYSPKIVNLVEEIAKLNLIEVSDLNELLRKKLNIKDVAMSYAAMPAGASQPAKAAEPEQEEAAMPKATKSSFKLKLVKYDEAKKVGLIKEIKALGENMNLVQAKKFVESLPQVFKDNISKEDAEKLKAQFEKAGATVEIE